MTEKVMPNDWQPIETAPKDGRHVLLRVEPFEWRGGCYLSNVTMTGYWETLDSAWCGTTSNWDGPFLKPFAWQPLPEPPPLAMTTRAKQDLGVG